MANGYYNHGNLPGDNTPGSSAEIRAEFDAVTDGFNKLAPTTGNANKVVVINAAETGQTVKASDALVADTIHAATGKTTPVDADELPLADSAATYGLKRVTFANLGAWAWSKLGALIAGGTEKITPVDADTIPLSDSAATNATKKLTFANLGAWVWSKLGALISGGTDKTTPVGADSLAISDSEAAGATKRVTFTNLLSWFAAKAGSASQVFSVSAPTSAAHAARWDTPDMASITVTQSGGALTFAGIAHPLTFRSATLTDGTVSTIIADPADLVLPSGGTLGFTSGVQGRIVVAEMNNAGTSEYAISSASGGLQVDEENLISTTAIGTGSDSANVWYSTTARTNLPYKIVCAVDVVNTAGAWGNPVLVQPAGGNSVSAMASLGHGQTWQAFTPGTNRLIATTYYNTTSKPIAISIMGQNYATGGVLTVNGITVGLQAVGGATAYNTTVFSIVPPGGSYSFATGGGNPTYWAELR